MNEIEKRARELLAAEYVKEGRMMTAKETMDGNDLQGHAEYIAIRAIVAALSAAPQVPDAFEPVAFCEPDNPLNSDAFAWPGTAREARHSLALYAAPNVPAGWVLVPMEPTDEMLQAASFAIPGDVGQKFRKMMAEGYAVMVGAKPEPQA